jgi:hypothetical protein
VQWDINAGDTAELTPYGAAISETNGYYESQKKHHPCIRGVQCEHADCLEALENAFDIC